MPLSIVTKFSDDRVRITRVREWTKSISMNFHQLRGHKSKVSWTIWLVIELDRDIMPITVVTKFGEDRIRIIRVRERTSFV